MSTTLSWNILNTEVEEGVDSGSQPVTGMFEFLKAIIREANAARKLRKCLWKVYRSKKKFGKMAENPRELS